MRESNGPVPGRAPHTPLWSHPPMARLQRPGAPPPDSPSCAHPPLEPTPPWMHAVCESLGLYPAEHSAHADAPSLVDTCRSPLHAMQGVLGSRPLPAVPALQIMQPLYRPPYPALHTVGGKEGGISSTSTMGSRLSLRDRNSPHLLRSLPPALTTYA